MKKHGPWKIKKRVVKYRTPWITLYRDEVIQPSGKDGAFSHVVLKPGVSVLALDRDNFVYLTKEFYYAIGRNGYGTVSGAIDLKETPIAAARRELKEEIGAKAGEWTNLGMIDPFTMVINSPAYLFLARELTFSNAVPEANERIKIIKVPFFKAVQMVMDSKITHGPSCVLILKANEYLRKNRK